MKNILRKIFWRNDNIKYKIDFILCLCLGWLGIHKFKNKKWGMGILYLCTVGLFYFGWIYDIGKLLYLAFILDNEGLEQYEINQQEKLRAKEEKRLNEKIAVENQKIIIESRKKEAMENGQACCPNCGSTSLSADKKGFGLAKGTAGVIIAGPLGILAAGHGKNKVIVTCLNCGKQFSPGEKY